MRLSAPAEMPFTRASAIQMLKWGACPEISPYTHKQIAEWCDKFWCKYLEIDAEPEIEPLLPILTSVETQWDLYLVNTYSIDELMSGCFEGDQMPKAWFDGWLAELAGVMLTESDHHLIKRALRLSAEGPLFPDWEFQLLFGLSRNEALSLSGYKMQESVSEQLALAVNSVIANLLSYPHGRQALVEAEVGPIDKLESVGTAWAALYPLV